ncbi:cytochrome b/b6 domain-containing protein [Sphingomonas sp. KRR8]|uniref:cytochrome b/b6 domain-containing protein n=1 Tax=Sphingomonas sp. KRR8 TaxID=2942996 RepID=UPI00201FD7EA|nr:cytochrome b/b6 domain-containing protein [Sphingomonas sp. KRR8]URD62406.1 cytochrome b/b6 domain-containing protein [Sphingomonas sp. KRR8]
MLDSAGPALPASPSDDAPVAEPRGGDLVKRHRLSTRIWHWVNAVTLLVMLMSGLMIFNAHPRLYWGQYGANFDKAWFEIGSAGERGFARLGPLKVETTGVLGVWKAPNGSVQHRAFPHWATIPSSYSLADARIWHLAFAWVLSLGLAAFMIISLVNRHFQKDLRIREAEIRPAHIWHDITEHARLRFPTGAAALRYNILQKLSYAGVIFVLLPLIIFTGMTMSPALTSGWSFLLDLFGGRQSARSLHFIAAFLLVAFFLVHIAMVLLAVPFNEVRSIITGRYRLPKEKDEG